MKAKKHSFFRAHPALLTVAILLIALVVLFDWNWFRPPLERYISKKTQRSFSASNLDVKLGMAPTIVLDNLIFGNSAWGKDEPMASVRRLEFSVSLRDLFDGKVLVPRAALTDAHFLFERMPDNRKNWTLKDPWDTSPSRFRISTLSVNNGRLRYYDYGLPFALNVVANTFDPDKIDEVKDAKAKPSNARYSTRYVFDGQYRDATFSGNALTGEVMSFQESNVLFPVKGSMVAGTTRLEVEGQIADAANISAIDVDMKIAGQTLANLYPFLLLPLPASPPYELSGRLQQSGNRYGVDKLAGRIGSTDISGSAAYVERETRPLLTADLHSKRLNMADLGPMIGIETKGSKGKPVLTQAQTNTRAVASTANRARDPNRVLPDGSFEGGRLQAIDADVKLESPNLIAPKTSLPFESIRASLQLRDAVLKLMPLEFGFAGGRITSQVMLDARKPVIHSKADIAFQRLKLERLFPHNQAIAKAAGTLGAKINLSGSGNSIADAAANADGAAVAVVANGQVSNLLDAASSLNGGKVIRLLIGGDRDIAVNCGVASFNIKDGEGKANRFLIDTAQTQVLGTGGFDLEHERFDLHIEPKPKRPGILSLRTPIHVHGTFKKAELELEKGPLTARALGALALGALNPLAALLPLIETGPGVDTNCNEVLAGVAPALTQPQAAKPAGASRRDQSPAKLPAATPTASAEKPRPKPSQSAAKAES